MNLQAVPVTSGFADIEKLKRLNEEAFPAAERIDLADVLAFLPSGEMDFLAIYDGDVFVGFTIVALNAQTAYLTFFAIDSALRSQGYGGRTLALLSATYPSRQIVLDIEQEDEAADNNEQRKSRKQFYLRNGYTFTGYCMRYAGLTFEVMCNRPTFDKESFTALLGTLKARSTRMGGPGFRPVLFQV